MPPHRLLLAACCFLLAAHGSAGLSFVVGPLLGGSLALDVMGIAAQLAARGHAVTVLAPAAAHEFLRRAAARHSSNTTAQHAIAFETVDLAAAFEDAATAPGDKQQQQQRQQGPAQPAARAMQRKYHAPTSLWQAATLNAKLMLSMHDVMARPCGAVLADAALMQRLRGTAPDAVLGLGLPVGELVTDGCVCVMAHALRAALVDVTYSLATGPPSVPQSGSCLMPPDLRTPRGAATNAATWAVNSLVPLITDLKPRNPWLALRRRARLPRAASSCPVSNVVASLRGEQLETCRSIVNVVLSSWMLEWPRMLPPGKVLVGAGTPRPPAPLASLPQVADFLESSHDGAVLVAFGSTAMFAGMLTPADFSQLAAGFASLAPVRVLWHVRAQGLPAGVDLGGLPLGGNTLVVSEWVDYNDVLGHPATRVFVTHGGIHSVQEAAFHGVPIVGMPFMFEQVENVLKLVARGAGVVSREAPAFRIPAAGQQQQQYSAAGISSLIRQVLGEPSYAASASALSQGLRTYARRRPAYERAADEVELAVSSWGVQQQQQYAARQQLGQSAPPREQQAEGQQQQEL